MIYNQSVFGGFVDTAKINTKEEKTVYYPHLQKKRKRRRFLPFFLRKKFVSTVLLVCMLVFYFTSMFAMPSTAYADDDEESSDYAEQMVRAMYAPFSLVTEEYAIYQGEMDGNPISFYYIDAVTNVEIEEHDEWISIIPSWIESPFKNIEGALQRYINGINNLIFEMNMYLATTVISVIGFAFNFDIIEKMLKIIEPSIMSIVGISGGSFDGGLGSDGGGLFGIFMELIFMVMVVVVFYNLIVNRRLISSLNVILRVILCLTLALVFFSNYSSALTGMHEIAKSVTSIVIDDVGGGITSGVANVGGSSDSFVAGLYADDNVTAKGNEGKPMKRLLWNILVERPYAYVQFGDGDIEGSITEARFEEMLSYIPNTEERTSYLIDTEIRDNLNTMVHADQVFNKMGFLCIVLLVNFLTAIPILLVALAIILLQFWYVIVAIIAPFALLLGAIPTMHRVLMRYGLELIIPLFLRVFLTTLLLLLLALTSLAFEFTQSINSDGSSTPFFISYIATAIFIIMLFVMTFLLRNRLSDIFSKGSTFLGELRSATGDLGGMMTGGVRGVSTSGGALTGAVIGGMATGGPGALTGAIKGANIGKALGNVATGTGDIAGTALRLHQLSKMEKLSNGKDEDLLTQTPFADKKTEAYYIPNKDNSQDNETGKSESNFNEEKQTRSQVANPELNHLEDEFEIQNEQNPTSFNEFAQPFNGENDEMSNGHNEIELDENPLEDSYHEQVANTEFTLQEQNNNEENPQSLADLNIDDETNPQTFVENDQETEIPVTLHDLNDLNVLNEIPSDFDNQPMQNEVHDLNGVSSDNQPVQNEVHDLNEIPSNNQSMQNEMNDLNEVPSNNQPLNENTHVDAHASNSNRHESNNVETNSTQSHDLELSEVENTPTATQNINTNSNLQSSSMSGNNLNNSDMQGTEISSNVLKTNDNNNSQSNLQSQVRSNENTKVVQNTTNNGTQLNSKSLNTNELQSSNSQSTQNANTQPITSTRNDSQNNTTNTNSQMPKDNAHQHFESHRVVDNASNIQQGNLNTNDISNVDGQSEHND